MTTQTTETTQKLKLGDLTIEVVLKNIKNLHLSVYPPMGTVRISAPQHMTIETIRTFAISKLSWIKQQQRKLTNQARETTRECINRESHYLWGKRYLLNIIEKDAPPNFELKHSRMFLQVRPGTDRFKKTEVLDETYRDALKTAIPPLIAKWEKLMGVKVASFTVRKMKTKWGSCSPDTQTIRLNLELAKKPAEYLEYVIVHEMLHLLEPTHNHRFVALINQFMPKWRFYQEELNRLPLRNENWIHQIN